MRRVCSSISQACVSDSLITTTVPERVRTRRNIFIYPLSVTQYTQFRFEPSSRPPPPPIPLISRPEMYYAPGDSVKGHCHYSTGPEEDQQPTENDNEIDAT